MARKAKPADAPASKIVPVVSRHAGAFQHNFSPAESARLDGMHTLTIKPGLNQIDESVLTVALENDAFKAHVDCGNLHHPDDAPSA